MIGLESIPSDLKGSRYYTTKARARWRDGWEGMDAYFELWLQSINETEVEQPITVKAFRSNASEICVLHEHTQPIIGWDERFFDFVLEQYQFLFFDTSHEVEVPLKRLLLEYVGECHVWANPSHALTLHSIWSALPRNLPNPKNELLGRMLWYYSIARLFVLAHEVGHIVVDQPRLRERELGNLGVIVELIQEEKRNPARADIWRSQIGGVEDFDKFADEVVHLSSDDNVAKEMLADVFAVRSVIDAILAYQQHMAPKTFGQEKPGILASVYDSIAIYGSIVAAMNGALESLKPRSLRQQFEIERFGSVRSVYGRTDVRGRLWMAYAAQQLGHDPSLIKLIHKNDPRLRDHYIRTQLPAFQKVLATVDRSQLLKRAADFEDRLGTKARRLAAIKYRYARPGLFERLVWRLMRYN